MLDKKTIRDPWIFDLGFSVLVYRCRSSMLDEISPICHSRESLSPRRRGQESRDFTKATRISHLIVMPAHAGISVLRTSTGKRSRIFDP